MYQIIRAFFAERHVLEVETPLLCRYGVTDPYIDSFECHNRYLQTSPEYAMKRLLAAGSGPIYQISKAFRLEEAGRYHNPEFTMLEWYRPGFDHHQLMSETSKLLQACLQCPPAERISYRDLFLTYAAIDPLTADISTLMACCQSLQLTVHDLEQIKNKDVLLQLIMSEHIEPKLGHKAPFMVYDYPATQAALAKIRPESPPVAERFEVYVNGIELANGFHELSDATEQQQRFQANQMQRQAQQLPEMAIDHYLIEALHQGIGQCAGIALGIDRLLMLITKAKHIEEVLSFSWQQC